MAALAISAVSQPRKQQRIFSAPVHFSGEAFTSNRLLVTSTTSTAAVAQSIRRGITWERTRTWHWQNVAGTSPSPTILGAAGYHSPGYLRWVERRWNRRRIRAYKMAHRPQPTYRTVASGGSAQTVICQVFGPYCSQALAVARCESGFSTTATNGQYVGLFQMGSSERATYGNGYTAREQSEAAYRYFVASGRDWSPWSCRP